MSRLVATANNDARGTLAAFVFAIALIGVIVPVMLRRQARRSTSYPGRRWSSRQTLYFGPDEEEGGPVGAAAFSAAHRGRSTTPIVRLVVTSDAIALVPSLGTNSPMVLPLADLQTVDLDLDPRKGGVRLTSATSVVALGPVVGLDGALAELGATVVPFNPD